MAEKYTEFEYGFKYRDNDNDLVGEYKAPDDWEDVYSGTPIKVDTSNAGYIKKCPDNEMPDGYLYSRVSEDLTILEWVHNAVDRDEVAPGQPVAYFIGGYGKIIKTKLLDDSYSSPALDDYVCVKNGKFTDTTVKDHAVGQVIEVDGDFIRIILKHETEGNTIDSDETFLVNGSISLQGYTDFGFLLNLGKPVVADVDRLVGSTNMANGEYTIDGEQPDIPRNITATVTAEDTADTMGEVEIVGTDVNDEEISETIEPSADSTVATTKAFKSVSSITQSGWELDGTEETNDTIEIGVGDELGLPFEIDSADKVLFGVLGASITADNASVGTGVSESTVDLSSETYDGSKQAVVAVNIN